MLQVNIWMMLIFTVKGSLKDAVKSAKKSTNKQLICKRQKASSIVQQANYCQNLTMNACGTVTTDWTEDTSNTGKSNKIK